MKSPHSWSWLTFQKGDLFETSGRSWRIFPKILLHQLVFYHNGLFLKEMIFQELFHRIFRVQRLIMMLQVLIGDLKGEIFLGLSPGIQMNIRTFIYLFIYKLKFVRRTPPKLLNGFPSNLTMLWWYVWSCACAIFLKNSWVVPELSSI